MLIFIVLVILLRAFVLPAHMHMYKHKYIKHKRLLNEFRLRQCRARLRSEADNALSLPLGEGAMAQVCCALDRQHGRTELAHRHQPLINKWNAIIYK